MTKLKKLKRKKTYNYNINRKQLRNKAKKLPAITCPQIKKAWELNKSTRKNLNQMGLAYDANEVLKIPNFKNQFVKIDETDTIKEEKKKNRKKMYVAMELEAEAKAPRERNFKLPKGEVLFITYLMDKYGDDYKAMMRDKKNYNQLTWRQIRTKINVFKSVPEQYAEYLVRKGEIVLDDPTPLEETRKKIAEENLKQHCTRKKPKKPKQTISQWIEEEVAKEEKMEEAADDDEFNTSVTLDDESTHIIRPLQPEKKLILFPDDEKQKKKQKREKLLEKQLSSDSEDSDEELEGDESLNFKDLSDLSEDELSDDDILDDGSFVTDSNDDSD